MSLLVKLGLDSSGLDKGLDQSEATAQKSASKINQSLKKVGDGMGKAGDALTLGLTVPLMAFGAASVKAAMDSESAMAELNAVIKSTGSIAGVTAKEVTDYATAMQKVTKFDDEAIISGQSMLLTFTKIGKDVFPAASTAMLNMAEKFGNVDQAAIQLGKALNDPVAGVGALRRVGVALSAQQEQQIKDFMAVGDVAAAQGVILKELEVEFGGLAKAAGATTAGKFTQFKNALGDLQEVVGAALLPALLELTKALQTLIDMFMKLPAPVQGAVVVFGIFLAALGPVLKIMSLIITVAGAFAPGGVFAGVAASLAGAGTAAGGAAVGVGALGASLLAVLAPIALVAAAVALLYFAFKNNFGGITDTTKMLVALMEYYFNWLGETASMALKIVEIGLMNIIPALTIVQNIVSTSFSKTFKNLYDLLNRVAGLIVKYVITSWRNLVTVIGWMIARINQLKAALASLKLPSWLTPGSPTPLETGIRGITDATKGFILQLPSMAAGLAKINSQLKSLGPIQLPSMDARLAEIKAQLKSLAPHYSKAQLAAMESAKQAAKVGTKEFRLKKGDVSDYYFKKGMPTYIKKGDYQDTYIKKDQYKDTYYKKPKNKREFGGLGSGMTLVGERGPEIVDLPAGSYVNTAQKSLGMMGGGGMTVNLIVDGNLTESQRREIIIASREQAMKAFGEALSGRMR